MKNSPSKVCSSSVQQDKMIVHDYLKKINLIDIKKFLKEFNEEYDTDLILEQLRETYRDSIWYVHGYIRRNVIINGVKIEIVLLRVKEMKRSDRDNYHTHVVLPSFLLPYMQTCVEDVIHICTEKHIIASDNGSNCQPFVPEVEDFVPPCISSFIGYITKKLKNKVINSISDLYRLFTRIPPDRINETASVRNFIFL